MDINNLINSLNDLKPFASEFAKQILAYGELSNKLLLRIGIWSTLGSILLLITNIFILDSEDTLWIINMMMIITTAISGIFLLIHSGVNLYELHHAPYIYIFDYIKGN